MNSRNVVVFRFRPQEKLPPSFAQKPGFNIQN